MNQITVVRHGPDDGVFLYELELLLTGTLPFDQLANGPQPMGSVCRSDLASLFDSLARMPVGQAE